MASLLSEEVRDLYVRASSSEEDRALLDDGTWNDLDMEEVAKRFDRSASLLGSLGLRRLLRTPTSSEKTLAERERQITALGDDPELSSSLRQQLERLEGTVSAVDVVDLLYGPSPTPYRHVGWGYAVLALVAAVSLYVAFAIGRVWVFLPIVAFIINGSIHFRARFLWEPELAALRFVGAMLTVARSVSVLKVRGIEGQQQRIATLLNQLGWLRRHLSTLATGRLPALPYEYINVFFLVEQQAFQNILRRLPQARERLREIFVILGELDALLGVARWRGEGGAWCRPEFHHGPPMLEAEGAVHPLLENAVPNSLTMASRGVLITGANMTGKSTFLRVLGVNAILAQTIGTCTARGFRSCHLSVRSSMRVADDLILGKSRYLAEAERLLLLVRQAGTCPTVLCLVDELLAGTNAAERLGASEAILRYLEHAGSLVVAATHDLELAHRLVDSYDSYFFADDFAEDDVRFDHRIRPGLSNTRNAISLLEKVGYPADLVENARRFAATVGGH